MRNQQSGIETPFSKVARVFISIFSPESLAFSDEEKKYSVFEFNDSEKLKKDLQPGDLIITSTPSFMYEHVRHALSVRYDHLAIVIDKDSVLHISPPKLRVVRSNIFLMKKRSPLILRLNTSSVNKKAFIDEMMKHIYEDYDYGRATTLIFSLLCERKMFRGDNLKKSEALEYLLDPANICTDLTAFHLYKTCPEFAEDLKSHFSELHFNRIHSFAPDDFFTLAKNGKVFQIIYQEREQPAKRMQLGIMQSSMMTNMRYWFHTMKDSGTLSMVEKNQWIKYLEAAEGEDSRYNSQTLRQAVVFGGCLQRRHNKLDKSSAKTFTLTLEIFNVELEWYFRYALVISNFVIIVLLLIYRGRSPRQQDEGERKNILFLIAHPDDETMFFIPSIVSLAPDYNLFLYCTTNGDYDGLGRVREKELDNAGKYLGFSDVHIMSDTEIKDGPQEKWDLNRIESKLADYVTRKNIGAIVTFDAYGVSGHSNHGNLYHLAVQMKRSGKFDQIKFYALQSVNIIRKYIGLIDMLFTIRDEFTYFSFDIRKNLKAMSLHYSQFVWYRKLFVFFSRYTFLNSLRLIS